MSIENSLKRIADAIEKLAEQKPSVDVSKVVESKEAKEPPSVPEAPKQGKTPPPPPAPKKEAAEPSESVISAEELNKILVEQFRRLGSREGIDQAIKDLGATSITDLPEDLFQELVDKVKAIKE